MGACFLTAFGFCGVIRGQGALAATIVFALSLILQPALHGGSRMLAGMLALLGILEVLPAIAGGLVGLALHNLRVWRFAVAAILAIGLIAIGPPR